MGIAAAGAGVLAVVAMGGVAVASSGDHDGNVTGQQADKATAVALRATHGGTANSVERDTENGATWEVEVSTPHDGTVDVRLDEQYRVVVVEPDSESH